MMYFYLITKNVLLYLPLLCATYFSAFVLRFPALALENASIAGAIVAVSLSKVLPGVPFVMLVLCAAFTSSLVGLFLGISHSYGNVSPLLANLIAMGLLNGLNQLLMGSAHMSFAKPDIVNSLVLITILGSAAFILTFGLSVTHLGYACTLYGRNKIFLQKHHISLPFVLTIGLMSAYALAGINGFALATVYGFIDTSMMCGTLLMTLTALILGDMCAPTKRALYFFAPLTGLILYMSLQQALLQCGLASRYFIALQSGLLLLLVVSTSKKSATMSSTQGL